MKKFIFMFMMCIFLVGCGSKNDTEKTIEEKPVEGIEASLNITSNSKALDEGFFQATISNETDETFTGSITFYHSSFTFWTEEINLPPGKDLTNELKTKYIKHPKDKYTYEVTGEFADESFASSVDYTIFKTDVESAFNVQMTEVTKESAVAVTKELLSIHGDSLNNISFFDGTETLEDGVEPTGFPKAAFYGNLASKTITIYGGDKDETFDLESH